MTLSELQQRIDVRHITSYGNYKVTIIYRGKKYWCITTDSLAVDCIWHDGAKFFYTERTALLALWNECKRKNNLR